jgi:hypothetical protein
MFTTFHAGGVGEASGLGVAWQDMLIQLVRRQSQAFDPCGKFWKFIATISGEFAGSIKVRAVYRTTVICRGLTEQEAQEAVSDMLTEFSERPWQEEVSCEWRDGVLRLSASTDFDRNGMALLDEFGDAINAYISYSGEIHLAVESVCLS